MTAVLADTRPRCAPVDDWAPAQDTALVQLIGPGGVEVQVKVIPAGELNGYVLDTRKWKADGGDASREILAVADDILATAGWVRTEPWVSQGVDTTEFAQLRGFAPYDYGSATVQRQPDTAGGPAIIRPLTH